MTELAIDIETYSDVDLASCGVYRYAESPEFAVLLFAYCVDGGEVRCVDVAQGEELPGDIRAALTHPGVTKTAFNANFERVCLSRFLGMPTGKYLDPRQWKCTMVAAARMGLPLSLGECAKVLRLSEGKMEEGRALIRYFSKPDPKGRRRMPTDSWDRWETFKEYNIRDVEVEQGVLAKVRRLEETVFDRDLFAADALINDRGVLVDLDFVNAAAKMDEEYKAGLLEEARELTGLDNPNSPAQLKEWLSKVTGFTVKQLDKSSLDGLEERLQYWPKAQRVIALRRELGKTSNKKYQAIQQCACSDGRVRGLLQYHGAARTGRWAGRLVQVQNLPQNHLDDLDGARRMVMGGDIDDMELEYGGVSRVLSELIRTSFIAPEGKVLHVCDFSAIEARVIAWLAGEKWVLDVFRDGGDVYCATASQMFGVPVEKHGRNAHLRQKGKIAVLALGYGGGVSALEAMGGSRMGLSEEEEREIVYKWRDSNPKIVSLWGKVEKAAIAAIKTDRYIDINRGITFKKQWGCLTVKLPSGRTMVYPRARVGIESDDGWRGDHDSIEYEGVNQTTRKWETMRTYGGKMTENIVQAIARDILGEVIVRAKLYDLDIVFHVHDEIVVEADEKTPLSLVEGIFNDEVAWARGLPLKGAGYTTKYYKKD
ncbi:MAG: DNA polymerase [Bacteroidales bacterium]|nr:DNA polymerase [Bacteroidales bacterium]MBR7051624.1 DNA polymerase [Bacteroidaceae bacterium]